MRVYLELDDVLYAAIRDKGIRECRPFRQQTVFELRETLRAQGLLSEGGSDASKPPCDGLQVKAQAQEEGPGDDDDAHG